MYKLSVAQNYDEAQYNLGALYEKDGDFLKALKYYTLSAKQGYAKAQYNLGNMYYNGKGLKADKLKAYRLFKMASQNGNEDAEKSLKYLCDKEPNICK